MKNGFNISIGCNLKKYKSNQRLAPFTSMPIIETRTREIKEKTNKGTTNLIGTPTFFKKKVFDHIQYDPNTIGCDDTDISEKLIKNLIGLI